MDFLRVNRCHIEQIEITQSLLQLPNKSQTIATQLLKWDRGIITQQCDTRIGIAHEIDRANDWELNWAAVSWPISYT
jgi:hypothetical protein